jgi:hypothetical protein
LIFFLGLEDGAQGLGRLVELLEGLLEPLKQ